MHLICFSAVHPSQHHEEKGHREEKEGKLGKVERCSNTKGNTLVVSSYNSPSKSTYGKKAGK